MFRGMEFILSAGLKDRSRIRRLLEDNGGKERKRRADGREREEDMVLMDPGVIKDAPLSKSTAIDVRFITNSVARGICERLSDYMVTNANPMPLAYEVNFASRRCVAHTNFTEEDDFAIFRFIVDKAEECTRSGKKVPVRGNKIWIEAEQKGIATPHPHESMRTRWLKFIEPRYEELAARLAEERRVRHAARAAAAAASSSSRSGSGSADASTSSHQSRGSRDQRRGGDRAVPSAGGGAGRPFAKKSRTGRFPPEKPFDNRRVSDSFVSLREDDVVVSGGSSDAAGLHGTRRVSSRENGVQHPRREERTRAQADSRLGATRPSEDAEEPVVRRRMAREEASSSLSSSSSSSPSSSVYESIVCDTPPEGMGEGHKAQRGAAGDIGATQAAEGTEHRYGGPASSAASNVVRNGDRNYCGRSDSTLPPGLDDRGHQHRAHASEGDFVPRATQLLHFMEEIKKENEFEPQWVADILAWEKGSSKRTVEVARALREIGEELDVPQDVVMRVYARTGNVGRTHEKVEAIKEVHQQAVGVKYDWIVLWMEAEGYDADKVERYLARYHSE